MPTFLKSFFSTHRIFLGCWLLLFIFVLQWNYFDLLRPRSSAGVSYLRGSDANYYLAWGHSLAIDYDIDFKNELHFLACSSSDLPTRVAFRNELRSVPRTSIGRVRNKYAMGSGLLSVPVLFLVRQFVNIAEYWSGEHYSQFSPIYALFYLFNQITLGFIGLLISYFIILRYYDRYTATLAVIGGTLSLSLWYYLKRQPGMAHAAGFCVSTVFIYFALLWHDSIRREPASQFRSRSLILSFVMGVALAVATLVRYPNAVLFLIPVVFGIFELYNSRARSSLWRLILWSATIAAMGFFIGLIPQLLAWKSLFGGYLVYSYEGEKFYSYPRNAFAVMFGVRNSLFLSTPAALLGFIGLVLFTIKRSLPLGVACLLVFFATVWVYGSWEHFGLGNSYGQRGFVDTTFFILLGLAHFIGAGREQKTVSLSFSRWRIGVFAVAVLLGITAAPVKILSYLRHPERSAHSKGNVKTTDNRMGTNTNRALLVPDITPVECTQKL